MEHIEYFKLQAKNLLKDYKTRFFNEKEELYGYHAKYFDINRIFGDFDIPDSKEDFSFTLMNAQHVIAQLAGFANWYGLIKASPARLELSHLLFDNAHKINIEEWEMYVQRAESMNHAVFNDEEKLGIYKQVFLNDDKHRSDFIPYKTDLEKRYNTPPKNLTEEDSYTVSNMYEEQSNQEKLTVIRKHQEEGFDFMPEEEVECLHCGERYQFKNVKALRVKTQYRTTEDFDEIVCKNYPRCSGSIIDFIRVKELENWKFELK
jgi:hypothetical protein